MRIKGSKAKTGRKAKCPKCGYNFKTKQNGYYICCSRCKRYSKKILWGLKWQEE